MAFTDPVSLPTEEIETTRHVIALKFTTGDVHKVPPLVLKKHVADALQLEEFDILAIYKLMGSGNTFYIELPPRINAKDIFHRSFELKKVTTEIDKLSFETEDAILPRTTIRLESVPPGTSNRTIQNYFTKFLSPEATGEDIFFKDRANIRDDVRLVSVPLSSEARIPDYIRFENAGLGFEQLTMVMLPGRRVKCYHCGSTGHFTYGKACPSKPKRPLIKPRTAEKKAVSQESSPETTPVKAKRTARYVTSKTPEDLLEIIFQSRDDNVPPTQDREKNGECFGLTQDTQSPDPTPAVPLEESPTPFSSLPSSPSPSPSPSTSSSRSSETTAPSIPSEGNKETTKNNSNQDLTLCSPLLENDSVEESQSMDTNNPWTVSERKRSRNHRGNSSDRTSEESTKPNKKVTKKSEIPK